MVIFCQNGSRHGLWSFFIFSMVCTMQNPKIFGIFRILGNIRQKSANFRQKLVPQLKIFNVMSRNHPKNLKFQQVGLLNSKHFFPIRFLDFGLFAHVLAVFGSNFAILDIFYPKIAKMGGIQNPCSKNPNRTIELPISTF